MSGIVINQDKCINCYSCLSNCPYNAIELVDDKLTINSGCKLCKNCLNNCPVGAITIENDVVKSVNKDEYQDILVYVEHNNGQIHPITFELIGIAKELVKVTGQHVNCIYIGSYSDEINELLHYGVENVYTYFDDSLKYFKSDVYTDLFADLVNKTKPSVILVGATITGRCLAPKVAVRFKTGLTADTTQLKMKDNTDLVQIRPAFGENIMAQIITTNSRPQMATVRYKVFDQATRSDKETGNLVTMDFDHAILDSKIDIIDAFAKPTAHDISNSEIIVAMGCGVKDETGVALVENLAQLLGATVGYTRPMVEKGIGTNAFQIGLSGRTVKPKLIITVGISGAIQFVSGMQNAATIIAINSDENAPIFKVAHYGFVGDLYEILPELIAKIKEGK